MAKKRQYTFIDLFAGCGGLSEGFLESGHFKGLAHIEWEYPMVQTLRNRLVKKWNETFEQAKMDESFDYTNDGIEKTDRKKNRHKQVQFNNRLFDRDTLLLFHYDVNFLFVLSLYARNNTDQKTQW